MDVNKLIVDNYEYALKILTKKFKSRTLAEDALQEACIKAIRFIHNLKEEKRFRSWLIVIAVRVELTRRRNDWREEKLDGFDRDDGKDMEAALELKQMNRILKRAVDKLPKRQRQAFDLRYREGLAFKDIAEIMNSPYDTAKANFFNASVNVRRVIKEIDQ